MLILGAGAGSPLPRPSRVVTSQRSIPCGCALPPLRVPPAAAAMVDRVEETAPRVEEKPAGAAEGGRQRWRDRKAWREQRAAVGGPQACSQDQQQGGACYTGTTYSKAPSHSWVAQAVPSIVKCLTEQRARAAASQTQALAPMVEWVYSRPGGLEFEAQQLRLDPWDPKYWRDWARSSSNGAAGMVFVRPITGPNECPLQPMEPRHSSSSSSSAASCGHEHAHVAEVVPELEGHIDVDNCCSKAQAARAAPSAQQATGASASSSPVEHHPPPYLSHIVPFHDPKAGSHSVGSSSHILDGVDSDAEAPVLGGQGGDEPAAAGAAAAALGGLGLGMPGARSRRRFRARLRANIDGSSAGAGGGGPGAAGALQQVAYYGLVAQSSRRPQGAGAGAGYSFPSLSHSSDGCYVLKMTQNMEASGGCTCTLFTLTRVCHSGPSLYQQLQESWLSLA